MDPSSGINIDFTDFNKEPTQLANSIQILLILTALSLAPAMLIVLSSFTRIIIVLSMLRHAFGMQQTPPNVVLISLALFLTLFSMSPVLDEMGTIALNPLKQGEITTLEAGERALVPLRAFMLKHTREKDLALILEVAKQPQPNSPDDIKTTHLIPAFMLSELQTAFQIGFVIFLPFLVIDLIVAAILMSMGMIMVPPLTISLPIKILVFVLIEGWALISHALIGSFF